jgi:AraC-like DNA-binding protein
VARIAQSGRYMKYFLRTMSDRRFKELLVAELELVGRTYTLEELEENELMIGADVKYTAMNNALKKCYEEKSGTSKSLLYERLKNTIRDAMQDNTNGPPYIKYSSYLSQTLNYSYPYLSALFSQMNGSTLEQYIITQRIEVAKRLLVEQGLGLSEIAWKLGYCSVPHLSNQFKRITGSTPTTYKTMAQHKTSPAGVLCDACKQAWVVSTDNG